MKCCSRRSNMPQIFTYVNFEILYKSDLQKKCQKIFHKYSKKYKKILKKFLKKLQKKITKKIVKKIDKMDILSIFFEKFNKRHSIFAGLDEKRNVQKMFEKIFENFQKFSLENC